MGRHQLPPQLRKLMRLAYVSPVLTVLSLTLLLWTYRQDLAFQFWTGYHRAAIPQGEKVSFTGVNGTKTVLVAAYQEHRATKKEVRIIAVVLRSETVTYRCILRCEDRLSVSVGTCDVHSDHFDFAYGTADIMCPLPSDCASPSHVAVISDAHVSEETLDKEFLEVKNRKAYDSFPLNFTVCLSTMFDFSNVLQLVQSLEMLQLLGVGRVVVYLTSCSPETQRVLDYYTQKGLVEVIPWSMSRYLNVSRGWLPYHGPGDLHYFGQIPALNDCMYRYMYRSRYLAQHDIDELILPQAVNSWTELLPLLEEEYGADRCYMFENNVFPISVSRPPPASQTLPLQDCCPGWHNVSGVNILAHLYQEPIITETHYTNFKLIVNPRVVFSPSVHGLLSSVQGCSWVDRSIARMYHTRGPKQTELTSDQLIYDGRLLSYSSSLIPKVNAAFRESGLLPEDGLL
ncbi:uncharacterized protein LOC131970760 isoform X2 [Centropristis striata]|uniref:uncharacterized protein LOC131970760 isoform X2 n=1 Tax=Centropristis striata TaxID=184440 RepID=UPI0027E11687|nr:uncharacterized protein LOC131970760 isoform X2 [Centropristis striata]